MQVNSQRGVTDHGQHTIIRQNHAQLQTESESCLTVCDSPHVCQQAVAVLAAMCCMSQQLSSSVPDGMNGAPPVFLGRPLPLFKGCAASALPSSSPLGVPMPSASALSAGAAGSLAGSSPASTSFISTSSSSDMAARAQLTASSLDQPPQRRPPAEIKGAFRSAPIHASQADDLLQSRKSRDQAFSNLSTRKRECQSISENSRKPDQQDQ